MNQLTPEARLAVERAVEEMRALALELAPGSPNWRDIVFAVVKLVEVLERR